jgi:phosphonate transport system substrate-binding protein
MKLNVLKMRFSLSLVLAMLCGCMLALQVNAQGVLRVSAIPDESPTELQRKFLPLGEYLSKETGMKVEFIPVTDYAAVVEALATNKIDMAWLGGFTYIQAKIRTDGAVKPIIQRLEDEKFTSKFIIPEGSSVKTLADLKGKTHHLK